MGRLLNTSLPLILMTVLVSILSMGACTAQQGKEVDYAKAFLVDVRTPAEFAVGSAKGAVNFPLNEVASRIDEFEGKGQVVVFCRSGSRSGQAKSVLDSKGIRNVVNGGTWQQVSAKLTAKK